MGLRKSQSTVFDVAAQAGVSIKTVSRVVNNEPNVRTATRDKVVSAINELGYEPNAAARGLSGKRSYALGLIYENPREFSYVGAVLKSALSACEELGYSLLLRPVTLPGQDLVPEVRKFVLQTRVDAIMLTAPVVDNPEVRQALDELQVPTAFIGPSLRTASGVNVFCDDRQASYDMTAHLIALGHRRIAFVKGHPDHSVSLKRLMGYQQALTDAGLPLRADWVTQGYFSFESGVTAAASLLEKTDRPTVIIASNDDMAAGVIFEARERGLNVPADLSVTGFDDTPLASHTWPPLTTIRQPIEAMTEHATRSLIARLQRPDQKASSLHFDCKVIIRGSSGPPL
jgi:LacI family transcriptional regulator